MKMSFEARVKRFIYIRQILFLLLTFSSNSYFTRSTSCPEETLVEVRSDSDLQIDRQTWV